MHDGILIHSITARNLESFLAKPSHAVLLTGPTGSGKYTLARRLAAALFDIPEAKLDNQPYLMRLVRQPDKQDIPIEAIREVIKALGLKVPGRAAVRRIVLIEDAQHLSRPAQNALLKSLEEPDAHTVFILTSAHSSELLPTVVSRTTQVEVKPVVLADAKKFFGGQEAAIEAAWRLSGGLPGLMSSLLGDEDNQMKNAANQAKELLRMDKYRRLLELDKISRDRAGLSIFLDGMVRVIQALYQSTAAKEKPRQTSAILKAMALVLDCQEALAGNALPRLVAIRLALKLPI